jgi:hypothetical protein
MRNIDIIRARAGRWRALYRWVRRWFRIWARLSAERDLPLKGRDINADLDDVAREMGRHEFLPPPKVDAEFMGQRLRQIEEWKRLETDFLLGGPVADAVVDGVEKDLTKGNT